jgi:hypothetical protein
MGRVQHHMLIAVENVLIWALLLRYVKGYWCGIAVYAQWRSGKWAGDEWCSRLQRQSPCGDKNEYFKLIKKISYP